MSYTTLDYGKNVQYFISKTMTRLAKHGARLSRRELIEGGLGGAAVIMSRGILAATPQSASANPGQSSGADLVLMNGRFVDGRGPGGAAIAIKNGRIVKVGQAMPLGPGAPTIDLGGRTIIPGFFDAHVHYTRAGMNPGHEARRIERVFSITELQETLARRAESVLGRPTSASVCKICRCRLVRST